MKKARRTRNSAFTTHAVLVAARRVFAKHGLAGTSLQLVEKESGISKGLILHHFGSKEGLYRAVLKSVTEEYTDWLKSRVSLQSEFPDLMRETIRASYRFLSKNNDIRRLRSWTQLEAQPFSNELEERFTRALIKAVADAQVKGIVRKDIPAVEFPFLIRAAIDYRLNNAALVRRMEKEQGISGSRNAEEQFVQSLSNLFLVPGTLEGERE